MNWPARAERILNHPVVTAFNTRTSRHEPEIHVFLLWSNALDKTDQILADIRARFTVLDVFSIEWSPENFASNLTRFYGQTLPAGSEKELHCGTGAFLVVVVEDLQPIYAARTTTRGKVVLNVRMFDAKRRYRRWTGGGHRVHATVNPREADKDLFLLLGRRAAFYRAPPRDRWDGATVSLRRDLTGANGWQSRLELLAALETVTGYVALVRPTTAEAAAAEPLELLVENVWWAARIANGIGESDADQRVVVAGKELRLALSEVGDGSLDPSWQHLLLSHSVRDPDGLLVPSPEDRFYLALHDVASSGIELAPATRQDLDQLARGLSLPPTDYGDRGSAAAALAAHVAQLTARPAVSSEPDRRIALPHLTRLMRRVAGRAAS